MPYFSGPHGLQQTADAGAQVMDSFKSARKSRLLSDYFRTGQADLGQLARYDPEAAAQIQGQQKQQGLAKLLGEAFNAPEDQRQGMLAQLMSQDPAMGMAAAKMMDPRQAGGGIPSELQTFQAMTKGMPENDVLTARRIQLGLDPRKSSAAIGYQKVIGPDGREMLVATDPRGIGAQTIGGGPSFGSFAGQQQQAPNKGDMEADIALANQMAQAGIDPEQIDAFIASRGQQAGQVQHGANQFASQTPQEKAYATESGQQRAQLDAMPERIRLDAYGAGEKETATITSRLQAERAGKKANERLDSTETIDLLGGAEKLLRKASGGMMESGRDRILGAFNQSTEGSRATAGLKILAAKLIQKVPRFEGPQSNIDVQSYREAAGDLANDQLPVGQRLAALQTMRELANRSVKKQQATPGGGWGIREIP